MLDLLANAPHYVISLLVLLTIVVFVHELGHFWVARRCGVRVEVFSVGFGPELFGRTDRFGTRWKFSAIPLGGYVKMFGQAERVLEADGREREMSAAERAVAFHHKSIGQRAAIVFAGPAANYVLTIVSLAILYFAVGMAAIPQRSIIGEVVPSSAAEQAGLKAGDRILAVNGKPAELFDQLLDAVTGSNGQVLQLRIERGTEQIDVSAQPRLEDDSSGDPAKKTYRLGIKAATEYQRQGIIESCTSAVSQTVVASGQMLVALWEMVNGTRSSKELGGVLRIGKIAGDVARQSYVEFLFLIPSLSLNLGLLNLFPIPLLDGGHLTFYAIEAVRGRPLGERAQEWGLRIGVALVLGLMVFATWNDLVLFKVVDYIKNLVT
ncbi:MAG TPA: RIP metalloprotease RseP [Candidatus Acidoferrum sp.]|nr:RIP metalloprotease RseP [Candidatus Acidoferrum sp.]